jgi:hypothetical protein
VSDNDDDISEVIYVDADDTRTVQPSGRSRPLLTVLVAGPQGPAGVAGLPGDDGDDGWTIPGPVGAQGWTGGIGAQGQPGIPGWQGDDGEDGWPGPPGPAATTNPLANFSAILPQAYLTPTFSQLLFTAPATNAGGYFSNTTAQWRPPPAPVVLSCSLVVSCFNITPVVLLLGIFKDGVQIASGSTVAQGDGSLAAASVTAVDVATGSNVYAVYAQVAGLQGGGTAQTQLIGTTFAGTIAPPIVGPAGVQGPPGTNGTNGAPGGVGAQGMSVIGPPGEDADDYGWPIPSVPGAPGPTGPPGPISSLSNPSALVGLTAVNGTSTTSAMRFDAAPALSQAIAPTWSAQHIFSYGSTAIKATGGQVSSSVTTGDIVTAGGMGVGGALYASGPVDINGGIRLGGLGGAFGSQIRVLVTQNSIANADLAIARVGTSKFCFADFGTATFGLTADTVSGVVSIPTNVPSTSTTTGVLVIAGGAGIGGACYVGGLLHTVASATGSAGLYIPSGTAPTSPNDGDVWYDGTNLNLRISSSTKTFAQLNTADQTVSGGANVTSQNLGTQSSGTLTIDCGSRPLQYVTNGGAFTLAAPANDGSCLLLVTNNGTAGTITFSGFTVGASTGDALDTTNAHIFTISIWRINGTSGYRVAAHQ